MEPPADSGYAFVVCAAVAVGGPVSTRSAKEPLVGARSARGSPRRAAAAGAAASSETARTSSGTARRMPSISAADGKCCLRTGVPSSLSGSVEIARGIREQPGRMSSSLLSPPEPPEPRLAPPPARRRRVPLAVLLTASALLGSGASVGVLAAAGAFDGGTSTTVIERTTATTPTAARTITADGGLDAGALYSSTSAGVVDITVTGTSSDQPATPFGGVPQQ